MRYVVTGAAGFIGSQLAETLLAAGDDVLGIDSFTSFYDPAIKERNAAGLEIRRVDLAEDPLDFSGWPFELYGDGSQTRSGTYVGDAVAATVVAMRSGSGTYNVGGSVEASLGEAIAAFERLAGRSLEVWSRPVREPRRTSADTTRLRRELGWRPETSLEQGIQAQWNWTLDRVPHAEWASAAG